MGWYPAVLHTPYQSPVNNGSNSLATISSKKLERPLQPSWRSGRSPELLSRGARVRRLLFLFFLICQPFTQKPYNKSIIALLRIGRFGEIFNSRLLHCSSHAVLGPILSPSNWYFPISPSQSCNNIVWLEWMAGKEEREKERGRDESVLPSAPNSGPLRMSLCLLPYHPDDRLSDFFELIVANVNSELLLHYCTNSQYGRI